MVIHCMTCGKLFYLDCADGGRQDRPCPACGSTDAEYVATTIIFDQPANDNGNGIQPSAGHDDAIRRA